MHAILHLYLCFVALPYTQYDYLLYILTLLCIIYCMYSLHTAYTDNFVNPSIYAQRIDNVFHLLIYIYTLCHKHLTVSFVHVYVICTAVYADLADLHATCLEDFPSTVLMTIYVPEAYILHFTNSCYFSQHTCLPVRFSYLTPLVRCSNFGNCLQNIRGVYPKRPWNIGSD